MSKKVKTAKLNVIDNHALVKSLIEVYPNRFFTKFLDDEGAVCTIRINNKKCVMKRYSDGFVHIVEYDRYGYLVSNNISHSKRYANAPINNRRMNKQAMERDLMFSACAVA